MKKYILLYILVFCTSSLTLIAHAQVTNGLIGLWHLDGNTTDASGNGHDGTIVGTVTQTAGKFDQAYHLDGSSYIDCGNVDLNSTGEFSVSAWVKTTDPYVTEVWRMVVSKLDGSAGGPLEMFLGDGRTTSGLAGSATNYLAWDGGTGLYNTFSSYDLAQDAKDGNWHNLAVTFKSGSQIVYFDGVQVGSTTSTDPLPNTTSSFHIGGVDFGAYHHPLIGDIDEVSVYNRALSAAEIQTLAQGNSCVNVSNLTTTNITSNSAMLNWNASADPDKWQLQYKPAIRGTAWTNIKLNRVVRSVNISSLNPNQKYKWRIRAKCGTTWAAYSNQIIFKTLAASLSVLQSTSMEKLSVLSLYPNPSTGVIILKFKSATSEVAQLNVYNVAGKKMFTRSVSSFKGSNTFNLNLSNLANGIYYLELISNKERNRTKFVIQK